MNIGDTVYYCTGGGGEWKCKILDHDPGRYQFMLLRLSTGRRFGPRPISSLRSEPGQCSRVRTFVPGERIVLGGNLDKPGPTWPATVRKIYSNGRIGVELDGLSRVQTIDVSWVFSELDDTQ